VLVQRLRIFILKEGRDFFGEAGNFYGEDPLGRGGGTEVFEGV